MAPIFQQEGFIVGDEICAHADDEDDGEEDEGDPAAPVRAEDIEPSLP
jgi:hypothetical protein